EADATIKQQLSLLQLGAGSQVIYGNLLVLPVGNSFLYLEPIFVQATNGKFPELQRVFVATQDRVAMADSFPNALAALFGSAPVATNPSPTPAPSAGSSSTHRSSTACSCSSRERSSSG